LSGGVHNIEVDDMKRAIDEIGPRIVVPMHYFSPKGRLKILPVDEMARRFPADRVVRVGSSELEILPETLPAETHLYILDQAR
jgi:L-ascorbate metabolism protein UlaG (beta-lactamase superfamily)